MTGRARANGEGSIFPYRNGYAAYVWVRTPAGLRKKKWVYGKTREEVHEKWVTLQKQAQDGPIGTTARKVGEYLTYWLEDVIRPNRAPLTYQTYSTFARLYIVPGLGVKRLDRLTRQDVQAWLNKTASTCQCCAQGRDSARVEKAQRCCAKGTCCETLLSVRTVSDIRACLRAMLNEACRDELIAKNVAAGVILPKRRRPKRKRLAWETDEAREFLESAKRDGDPLYAAYVIVLVLGFRKGEVLGLCWDDINFDSSELIVGFQLQRVGRRLLHRETKSATSEDVPIPLPGICLTALKLRKQVQQRAREVAGAAWQGGDKLAFTSRYGLPIEPRTFNRAWDARCAKAGVRRITVHDGRRSCGTLLAELGVHPRVAMQILRHAQLALTMEVYTLATSKQTRRALKRLGKSLEQ